MLTKLHVRNLPASMDASDLEDLFTTVGNVIGARVALHPEKGGSLGHGYVEMATVQEAADCIERFNGMPIQGQILSVREDKPHVPLKKPSSKRGRMSDKQDTKAASKEIGARIRAAIIAARA